MTEGERTLAEQMEMIQQAMEIIETEASVDISEIVERCEEKTGRPFEMRIKSGQPARHSKVISQFQNEAKLKNMVRILAARAALKFKWDKCKFKEWAEPIFDEEWDKYRR